MIDTKGVVGRAPGRPRGFDRERALATAMELFWRHGYEGVSIADLTAAMGVAPPSLYAAFGRKADLYREALDRYALGPQGLDLTRLDRAASLGEAVDALLAAAVASVAASGRACMITSGMLACSGEHDALARELIERRRALQTSLEAALARWMRPGQAASLARYLVAVMQGLSAQAHDGATRSELETIADHAKAAVDQWPAQPP